MPFSSIMADLCFKQHSFALVPKWSISMPYKNILPFEIFDWTQELFYLVQYSRFLTLHSNMCYLLSLLNEFKFMLLCLIEVHWYRISNNHPFFSLLFGFYGNWLYQHPSIPLHCPINVCSPLHLITYSISLMHCGTNSETNHVIWTGDQK